MEEQNGIPTSTETEETTEESTESETQEETEENVDWQAEAKKAKELADNYKKRAEKAEKKAKEAPAPVGNVSQSDILYLAKADIHEDDIGYVTEYAQKFGISIKEAHAQTSPILAQRKEERTTAQVTSTKSARGIKTRTGEDYLEKAEQTGEIPTDDKGMQALILARQSRFKRK
jgi:hypothetical protein